MRTSSLIVLFLLLGVALLAACLGMSGPASARIPASTFTPGTPRANIHRSETSIDVELPSDSTGVADGTLALRILAPASPDRARYSDGAPVLIFVQGGDTPGTLRPVLAAAEDTIRIVFMFPGGVDQVSGRRSDGAYDHRGPQSIAALRDVVRFAAGELTDAEGRTINELVSTPVLHDNIGLLGASNGGNIVVAMAAQYGEDLSGALRYIIQWESPVSSQMATVDLGGVRLDCPERRLERLAVVNPRYRAYGSFNVDVDYGQIMYDPTDPRHPLFLDGNGDGRYTTVVDALTGCLTPDLNGDGALSVNEDWPLSAYTDGERAYYSRSATQALADAGLFTIWPASIATPAQTAAFWDLREAVRLYDDALAAIPDLEGMVLASYTDHVQTAPDHPHIRQAFEGWRSASATYVKLNPDPAYLAQADPTLAERTDLPALPPNTPPADWNAAEDYTVPEDVSTDALQSAAVWQMADRIHEQAEPAPSPTAPAPTATPDLSDCRAGSQEQSPLYDHNIYLTTTQDGRYFTASRRILEHASVADLVIGPDGRLWAYYVNGEPGHHGIFAARQKEDGAWEVMGCVKLDGAFNGNAVDPDVIRLPDGRIRLVYFEGFFVTPPPSDPDAPHPIYSAISDDGLNFTSEELLISAPRLTDPSLVQLPDGSYLLAVLQGGVTALASSEDGHSFQFTGVTIPDVGIPELAMLPDGRLALYLSRLYTSTDGGRTWRKEPDVIVPGNGADPSLVALPQGGYAFSFKQIGQDAPMSTVSINQLHGWSPALDNNLKLFDAVVDETRNRVYVQGILSPGIAVIDGATDALTATVDSGMSLTTYHRTYLAVHPTTGVIYVADYSGRDLRRIASDSGGVSAPVRLSGRPTHILLGPAANRVFLSMKDEHRIAVYDATSLTLVKEVDVSPAAPLGMVLSPAGDKVYIMDSRGAQAGRSQALVLDAATLTLETSITFANPTGRPLIFADVAPESGDLFITTPEDLFRVSPAGAVRWRVHLPNNAKAPYYWAATGKVYVVSRNGISPVRSTLAVVDAASGAVEKVVDLGIGGAQRVGFNRSTGKIYAVSGEFTAMVVVDARTYQVTKTLDLGNSVEDVAIAGDGTAYFANRLGGSTVIAYRADTGAWNEFDGGLWPTGVDVDGTLNRLFVLSHFDGAVSAYDLSDSLRPRLLARIPLGLKNETDAISAQIVDATHHRVITAHPERDKVVIVDGEALRVLTTIDDIPSLVYRREMKGRGLVQLAVDEGLNKLYVLVQDARKIDVFDGNAGYAYLGAIDLSQQPWERLNGFRDLTFWADSARHRLYIGPIIVDTTRDAVVGVLPEEAGAVVVAQDDQSLYTLALATPPASPQAKARSQTSGAHFQMTIIDRTTYGVTRTLLLRPQMYVPPYVGLDATRGRLYVGYMQPAEVDIYALKEGAGSPTPTPTPSPGPTPTPTPTATPGPGRTIDGAYLMTFLACDNESVDCSKPINHQVFLAQSDDGANWSLVPGWEPYTGSVPDVIRRGDTLYIYTPGFVRRYRFSTDTWESPVPVILDDADADGFVDPSLIVDDSGRLVLFYLPGIRGQDPAQCAPGETSCMKYIRSATEVAGSDGTRFVVEPGNRVEILVTDPPTASDPDIFYDGTRYVLYVTRGPNVKVYTSDTLHGAYQPWSQLPDDGNLTSAASIPAGYYDRTTEAYWTYGNRQGTIYRAVHATIDAPLSFADFLPVLDGAGVGLGASYGVGSPGFAVNTPGPTSMHIIRLPWLLRR